jgi:hypothetical protein
MGERARAIEHHKHADGFLLKIPFDVDLIASSIKVPIDVARIVAKLVGAVFSEFNTVSAAL